MTRFVYLAQALFVSATVLSASTLVTYPLPTTLENIAIGPDGNLFVTSLLDRIIYRITPGGSSQPLGRRRTLRPARRSIPTGI